MSKHGVFSSLYFPVFGLNSEIYGVNHSEIFSPNAGKYRPEKTPHLDTFYPVKLYEIHFLITLKKVSFLFLLCNTVFYFKHGVIQIRKIFYYIIVSLFKMDKSFGSKKFSRLGKLLESLSKKSIYLVLHPHIHFPRLVLW